MPCLPMIRNDTQGKKSAGTNEEWGVFPRLSVLAHAAARATAGLDVAPLALDDAHRNEGIGLGADAKRNHTPKAQRQ